MTNVQDTLTYADGRLINGRMVISWPIFQFGGVAVAAGMQAYDIVNGTVNVSLYSNLNAQPLGVYYTVVYELEEGAVYEEYWILPNVQTVNIGQIRVVHPATPSVMINALQLLSAGAQAGQFLGWNGSHWVPMFVTMINIVPNTIGLNLSSSNTGTDLSVSDSPAQLGNSFTLNVPDASPMARGVVTIGPQTFAGSKSFQDTALFTNGIMVSGASSIAGYVPTTRQVNTGYGLAGGGSLAADLNLVVVDNTSVQKVQVLQNTVVEGTRHAINFIAGPNIIIGIADNPTADWVDVTLESLGGGGGGGQNLPIGSATGDMLNWVQSTVAPPGFWTVLPRGGDGTVLSSTASGVTWIPGVHQSPWLSNIDAANFRLDNLAALGVGTAASASFPVFVYSTGGIQYPVMVLTAGLNNYGLVHEETSPTAFAGFLAMNDATSNAGLTIGGSNHANASWRNNAVLLSSTNLVFATGPGTIPERMRLTSAGNLGIGTPNPGSLLEINKATDGGYHILCSVGGSPKYGIYASSSGNLNYDKLTAPAVTVMTLSVNGYVGIGTANPQSVLHVVSGSLSFLVNNLGSSAVYLQAMNLAATAWVPMCLAASLVYTNNPVSVGTSTNVTIFQVRAWPVDAGSLTPRGAAFIKSATFNGGSAPAAAEPALILGREGLSGQSFANFAQFYLSRWQNVGVSARTQLDIALTHDAPSSSDPIVLTLRSDGRVNLNSLFCPSGIYVNPGDATNQVNGAPWYGLGYAGNLNMVQLAGFFGINFQTGGGGQMVMSSVGNVGIRTNTPVSALQVVGPSGLTSFTGASRLGLSVSGSTGASDYSGIDFVRGTEAPYARIGVVFSNSGSYMSFGTSNNYGAGVTNAALTIDPSGNVGIGGNPSSKLDVQFGRTYLRAAGEVYVLGLCGYPGWPPSYLGADSAGNFILSNMNGTELFRIMANGSVGMGNTNPQYRLDVNGGVNVTTAFYINGAPLNLTPASKLTIYRTGTLTGVWDGLNFKNGYQNSIGMLGNATISGVLDLWYDCTVVSDERIKQNVVPLTGGLDLINQLQPMEAEYNGLGGLEHLKGQRVVSVMAQQLQQVSPKSVRMKPMRLNPQDTEDTQLLSFDPNEITWQTVLAVQQLDQRLKVVEGKVP